MIRYFRTVLAAVLFTLAGVAGADVTGAVNVNTADAATLAQVLKGVGQSRAEAIVRYREEHGEFVDIYELANVKGIGERTVEMNAERILLEE